MLKTQAIRTVLILLCISVLGACSAILRHPVPEDDYLQTSVLDRHDLREWGDQPQMEELPALLDPEHRESAFGGIMHTEHNYLAISGGGANGAYGAGVLVGWTKLGTRPQFTMVTGVSTGALTAPFAFLGPAYDQQLKLLYTTLDSSSIFSGAVSSLFYRATLSPTARH